MYLQESRSAHNTMKSRILRIIGESFICKVLNFIRSDSQPRSSKWKYILNLFFERYMQFD